MIRASARPRHRRLVAISMATLASAFSAEGPAVSFAAEPNQPEQRPQRPPGERGRRGDAAASPDVFDLDGRPGGERMGPRRDVSWERMPEPERAKLLDFVKEHFPRMFVELEHLRDTNANRFEFRMSRFAPELANLMELSQKRPELAALMIQERRADMEMHLLTMRYRNADTDEQRTRIRGRMAELAGELFDARHERRAMMVRELETRLGEMKQRHNQADRMRAKLIEQEVRERLDREPPERRRHRAHGPPDDAPPPPEERP